MKSLFLPLSLRLQLFRSRGCDAEDGFDLVQDLVFFFVHDPVCVDHLPKRQQGRFLFFGANGGLKDGCDFGCLGYFAFQQFAFCAHLCGGDGVYAVSLGQDFVDHRDFFDKVGVVRLGLSFMISEFFVQQSPNEPKLLVLPEDYKH